MEPGDDDDAVSDGEPIEESLDDDDLDDRRQIVTVLEVWSNLIPTVEVFIACNVDAISTGMGIHYVGISPVSIRAACALLRTPRHDWPDICADVQMMGRVVANSRNARLNRK